MCRRLGHVFWINGAWGSGKTTMSCRLIAEMDWHMVNPEIIGSSLIDRRGFTDYQYTRRWSVAVTSEIREAARRHPVVVVPMTLIVPTARVAIFERLEAWNIDVTELTLNVMVATARSRLRSRGDLPGGWCERQLPRFTRFLADSDCRYVINTDFRSIEEVYSDVLSIMQRVLSPCCKFSSID